MPLSDSQIWTVQTANARLGSIQQNVDSALGLSLDWDRTPDEAWSVGAAALAQQVDEGTALAMSTTLISSAPPSVVYTRAVERGLSPKAARYEEVFARLAVAAGPSDVSSTQVVVDDQGRQWTILGAYTSADLAPIAADSDGNFSVSTGDYLLLRAPFEGVISYSTWSFQPSVSGVTLFSAGTAIVYQIGVDAESTSELRARLASTRAAPGGSAPALRSALLDIPGVEAASVSGAAGVVTCRVAFAGVDLVTPYDVATTIYDNLPAGASTTGAESVAITGADGLADTIFYSMAETQTVVVTGSIVSDGSVPDSDLLQSVRTGIDSYFGGLSEGDVARWFLALAAAKVPGVIGLTSFQLDGGTSDVSPSSSTTLLVADLSGLVVAP